MVKVLDEDSLEMPGCHRGGLALFRQHRLARAAAAAAGGGGGGPAAGQPPAAGPVAARA